MEPDLNLMEPLMQFEIPAVPVLLPLWVSSVVVAAIWLQRRRLISPGRMVTVLLAATYGAAVLALTLLPLPVATGVYANKIAWYEKLNLIPVLTIDLKTFILNIVMTVPLGMLAPLLIRVHTRGRAALIGLLFSLAIELVQGASNIVFSSGRTADINDVIANTAGAVLGWYVFHPSARCRRGRSPPPPAHYPPRRHRLVQPRSAALTLRRED